MNETVVNIRVLDAAYRPFPPFAEWLVGTSVDSVRWERYNSSLNDTAAMSPEVLERARNIAKRAAALDTGAIEGLYEVDRGFTYTVAFETAAWEAALSQKGEHVRSLFEAQLHAYDYVLDLATKAEPISEASIRALHEEVCRAQPTYRELGGRISRFFEIWDLRGWPSRVDIPRCEVGHARVGMLRLRLSFASAKLNPRSA